MPDPAGIGHDGDSLQLRAIIHAEVEIVPSGAGKPGTDLIIQPDLAVPFERRLHRRPQHIVALFVGDPSCRDDTDDVAGQLLDKLDHRVVPLRFGSVGGSPAGARRRVSPKSVWPVRGIRT
jgi:hypothetical protein